LNKITSHNASEALKEKILIVRVGRVGDMVMITAALKAILDEYPQAEIHVLTGADGKRVLSNIDRSSLDTTIRLKTYNLSNFGSNPYEYSRNTYNFR